MKTYVVYFRNGGLCKITCETFVHYSKEGYVMFVVGNRNIAIFETDAIIGFREQDEDEEDG